MVEYSRCSTILSRKRPPDPFIYQAPHFWFEMSQLEIFQYSPAQYTASTISISFEYCALDSSNLKSSIVTTDRKSQVVKLYWALESYDKYVHTLVYMMTHNILFCLPGFFFMFLLQFDYLLWSPSSLIISNFERSFNSTTFLDQWIKFGIFTETKKLDTEGPLTVVVSRNPSTRGTIRLMCESVDNVIKTVGDGHIVKDPDNELAARGITGKFLLELRLQVKEGLPNRLTFIVDKIQPPLGQRLIPRELPKLQPQQYQGYPKRNHNQGRNQNLVPANNSELPRHLRPQTCSATLPRPVFHHENNSNPG